MNCWDDDAFWTPPAETAIPNSSHCITTYWMWTFLSLFFPFPFLSSLFSLSLISSLFSLPSPSPSLVLFLYTGHETQNLLRARQFRFRFSFSSSINTKKGAIIQTVKLRLKKKNVSFFLLTKMCDLYIMRKAERAAVLGYLAPVNCGKHQIKTSSQ